MQQHPEPKEPFPGVFYVSHSSYSDQGCREYMEDTYIAINHMTLPYSESSKRRRRAELSSSASSSVPMTGVSTSALSGYNHTKNRADGEGNPRRSPRGDRSGAPGSTADFRRRASPPASEKRVASKTTATEDDESTSTADSKDSRTSSTEIKKKTSTRTSRHSSARAASPPPSNEADKTTENGKRDQLPPVSLLSSGPAPKLARLHAQHGPDGEGGARRSSFHSSSPTMLSASKGAPTTPTGECMALFSVFDGHAGPRCSKFLKDHFAKIFFDLKATRRGEIPIGLYKAFAKAENQYCQVARAAGWPDGSTAVVAVVHGQNLLMAHVGDSRAVLCRGKKAIELTNDHKPDRPDETDRILSVGGTVEKTEMGGSIPRVNGHLAVSRSFGDLRMKETQRYVSAEPEMSVLQLTPEDKFFILASDGLWDVLTNQEAVDFVRRDSSKSKAARNLVKRALKIGTTDNVSALVVWLTWVHNTPQITGVSKLNSSTDAMISSPRSNASNASTTTLSSTATGESPNATDSQDHSPPASPRDDHGDDEEDS